LGNFLLASVASPGRGYFGSRKCMGCPKTITRCELLAESLKAIELSRPGTLEKLSHIKPKSKRIVSHVKKALFDSKHLSEGYGAKLLNGWWYGTNNSAQETKYADRACMRMCQPQVG
jgi:hypothetical protein